MVFLVLLPANVRVTSTRNGWMTSPVPLEWVSQVWGPNTDDIRRLLMLNQVLNQAPIQKTEATKEAIGAKDTDIVFVPGGCTPVLQPADVSWMKPSKDAPHEIWASFFREGAPTPKGKATPASHLVRTSLSSCRRHGMPSLRTRYGVLSKGEKSTPVSMGPKTAS